MAAQKNVKPNAAKKPRKPRTTDTEERLQMVDKKIAQLQRLLVTRKALIDKAAAVAAKREKALEKNKAELVFLQGKRERILRLQAKRESQMLRNASREERAEVEALLEALKASGKKPAEVIANLNK